MANEFYTDFDTEALPGSRPSSDHRNPFQVDRDRVIFSYAFRRLQSKTQVFQSGEYDFYRTRLTHSLEVSRVARSICEYLKAKSSELSPNFYIDSDLLEAIGLAHDLGHPPFGHIGERKLNDLMADYGGFEGNAQTLRILTELIYERESGPEGMSPTRAFLDGILKYKKLFTEYKTSSGDPAYPSNHFLYQDQSVYRDFVFNKLSIPEDVMNGESLNKLRSIECQIMDWADDTAYSLHDILDGIHAGFLTRTKIEQWAEGRSLKRVEEESIHSLLDTIKKGNIEARLSNKIGHFIQACELKKTQNFLSEKTNRYAFRLEINPDSLAECELYKKLCFDLIFESPHIQQIEFKGGRMLQMLFEAYFKHYVDRIGQVNALRILPSKVDRWVQAEDNPVAKIRRICDYLADMTDLQAIRTYRRLFEPEYGSITDLN